LIEIIPNWHPILVHFAVALLFLSVVLHGFTHLPFTATLRSEWRTVAQWALWLGALFVIPTAMTGWLAYNSVDHDDISHAVMTTHRNWALITASLFVVLAMWSVWQRLAKREPGGKLGTAVFLVALLTAVGPLGITAWYGGELVYRHGLGVKSLPNTVKTPVTAPNRPPVTKRPVHDHSTHTH